MWAAPWALIGLVGLPLAWWWHRRQRRPRTVGLSSLLFLQPELDAQPVHRRVLDPELWLALLAILLLVLAAAMPAVVHADEGRTLRVVVSKGAPGTARGYDDRVSQALDVLRRGLGSSDRMVLIEEPMGGADFQARPSPGALRAMAQGGDAAFRAVISDAEPPAETAGVTWISVGSPETFNVGLVAASLVPGARGLEIFVNVRGDDARAAVVRLITREDGVVTHETPLDVPAGGFATSTIGIPRNPLGVSVELRGGDGAAWEDDLAADDRVVWSREAVAIRFGARLPAALRQAVEDALLARFGRGGFIASDRDIALTVTTQDVVDDASTWTLVLHPAQGGAAEAPPGVDHALDDPLVADLGTAEIDLVYASGVADNETGRTLLWREAGGRRWPVVTRSSRVVHFLPDPTRGRPSPATMPLWPLFLDNLLVAVTAREAGTDVSTGRRRGLLDPESSRLGRVSTPVEVPSLAAAPADRPVRTLRLAPWLLGAALVTLGILWLVPWSRTGRRRNRRSPPVPSSS